VTAVGDVILGRYHRLPTRPTCDGRPDDAGASREGPLPAGRGARRSTPARAGLVLGLLGLAAGGLFLVLWLMQDALTDTI